MGRQDPSASAVALVDEVVNEAQRQTAIHQLELRAAEAGITGHWDEARIERVTWNLVSNAVKYSPAGGSVRVELKLERSRDGADVAVARVRDEGIGIPTADQAQLFEWFYRAANAREVRGTGLGLANARRVVEQHGGTIQVDSVEGSGSIFTVRLPLSP